MALLTGLPVPKLSTPQDAANEQTGSGMRNFLSLMGMIQGGQADAAKLAEQKTQQANMQAGLSRVKEVFQFASTPNDRLNILDKNPQLLIDPYTAPFVKAGLDMQKEIQQIRQGTQAAKAK